MYKSTYTLPDLSYLKRSGKCLREDYEFMRLRLAISVRVPTGYGGKPIIGPSDRLTSEVPIDDWNTSTPLVK
jgi:hypothetical protein